MKGIDIILVWANIFYEVPETHSIIEEI